MKPIILATALVIIGLITGCASTTRALVSINTPQSNVYNVVVKTLVRNGFQIHHSDRESGIISANRPVKNLGTNREGRALRITILVEEALGNWILSVTWTPPQWSVGTFKSEHDEFINGLSLALPNGKITSNY